MIRHSVDTAACHNLRHVAHLQLMRRKSGSSSQRWLQRQRRDPFVKQAKTEEWRCRSAYKLLQMDDKYGLLRPGQVVVDCGAAPGSWTQVAVNRVGSMEASGMVIGVDLLPMRPIDGATILDQTDFTSPGAQKHVLELLPRKADIVMSDMAPRASGNRALDHDVIVEMAQSVLRFARAVLQDRGTFLCKLWEGDGRQGLENDVRRWFEKVSVVKPEASRKDSAEIYILGRGYRGIRVRDG